MSRRAVVLLDLNFAKLIHDAGVDLGEATGAIGLPFGRRAYLGARIESRGAPRALDQWEAGSGSPALGVEAVDGSEPGRSAGCEVHPDARALHDDSFGRG